MKITCSHPSIISQSPWLRLSRFVTSSTLLQVYQPQKKRNREKLNELNFSPQNHAGLRNPCSHHRKPAPRLFSKQLLTYTQFLTPGKIFNSFAWTGYLLQNQKKTLSSLCGKLHHHNQMIANLWVKMGSKKTSKLLSKRKSGRKRRGGLERERERKGVSSPPLLFPPTQAICVPAEMSFVSSHQPSPSKFLTMVSQKATGAVQERGSLDIRQRILHQPLGVHCKWSKVNTNGTEKSKWNRSGWK